MACFRKSFRSAKCKALLKLVLLRIKVVRKKHEIQLKHMRLDVSRLLQKGEDENALARVVHVIREQNIVDGFNMIESFCNRIIEQMSVLRAQKSCPTDLQEAVSSLLFAGPRCAKLPELLKVRELFSRKYGKDFVNSAIEPDTNSAVSKEIIGKLSSSPPVTEAKVKLMQDIAQEYGLAWDSAASLSVRRQQSGESVGLEQLRKDFKPDYKAHKAESFLPVSESDSYQFSSRMNGSNGSPAQQYLFSEEEDDVEFEARNQFIVSIKPIRTSGKIFGSEDSAQSALQVKPNKNKSLQESVQDLTTQKTRVESVRRFKSSRTYMESQAAYEGMIVAAEAVAESADHAAAAAKATAMLAMKALSRETLLKVPDAEPGTNATACEESTYNLHGSQNSSLSKQENCRSSWQIPARSFLSLPAEMSFESHSDLRTQPVSRATISLEHSRGMPSRWGSNDLGEALVESAINSKSSNVKTLVPAHHPGLPEDYSSVSNTNNGLASPHSNIHERTAPQLFGPTSECAHTCNEQAQMNLVFYTSGQSCLNGTVDVNKIAGGDQKSSHQSSQLLMGTMKTESPVYAVHLKDVTKSPSSQKTCQEMTTGGKEQTRRQENTRIHPLATTPRRLSSKSSKKPTSSPFFRIVHSCLSLEV